LCQGYCVRGTVSGVLCQGYCVSSTITQNSFEMHDATLKVVLALGR